MRSHDRHREVSGVRDGAVEEIRVLYQMIHGVTVLYVVTYNSIEIDALVLSRVVQRGSRVESFHLFDHVVVQTSNAHGVEIHLAIPLFVREISLRSTLGTEDLAHVRQRDRTDLRAITCFIMSKLI